MLLRQNLPQLVVAAFAISTVWGSSSHHRELVGHEVDLKTSSERTDHCTTVVELAAAPCPALTDDVATEDFVCFEVNNHFANPKFARR
jgi:hypothetical protein